MIWKNLASAFAVVAMLATTAFAQVTLDGSISGDGYGSAVAVQTVQTQFGDSSNASPNGSELNAAYGFVSGGNLHLTLTGNLEANFNKMNIFIDSVAGGENTITANSPNNDNWNSSYQGFTFDNGFDADYMFIVRRGEGRLDLDFNQIGNGADASNLILDGNIGGNARGVFGAMGDVGANGNIAGTGIGIGFDNSNEDGVTGGTAALTAAQAAMAADVETGLELVVPLALLGNPSVGDEIMISAMINNGGHNFLSNQFLGGLSGPQGNLGGDGSGGFTGNVGGLDLNTFGGTQYFSITVVPEPSAAILLSVAALGLIRRRR